LGLAMEWAGLHKKELLENWNLLQSTGKYNKIDPLIQAGGNIWFG
jgi:hypothetical protein